MKLENLEQDLRDLKLLGMLEALRRQSSNPEASGISFIDRLTLLLDHEKTHRSDKKLKSRMKIAKLKEPSARIEDITYPPTRGIKKQQILELSDCIWVVNKRNIILHGPTGTGKTFVSCSFGSKACGFGYHVRYYRCSQLLRELTVAKSDGSYSRISNKLKKTDLLIIDDWGMSPFTEDEAHNMFELIDDRHNSASTIFSSQIPATKWYEIIGEDTVADAIMDRIINTSYNLELKGPSLRVKNSLNANVKADK